MFKVGDVVALTDGKNTVLSHIDGVKKGHLSVGCLLFDWCGNEVDAANNKYKIFPLKVDKNKERC